MTMCELATIVQENIKVNIAIINNGYLGHGPPVAGVLLRQALRRHAARRPRTSPKLGQCLRHSRRARHQPRRRAAHDRSARASKGPVLIDFRVEQEDSVYPMVPAGGSLHEMIRRPNNPLVETATEP